MVLTKKDLHAVLIALLCATVGANGEAAMSVYRAPFSLLQMLPQMRDAVDEYVAHKKAQEKVVGARRSLMSDEDFTDISGAADNDDEEEIIDPSEMPDTWGNE